MNPRPLLLLPLSLLLAAAAAACGGSSSRAAAPTPTRAAAPPPAPARTAGPAERFDLVVRDDFFAGLLQGDLVALDRAMKVCEDTLRRDPRHAEAMVWHGGGRILRAGIAFRAGKRAQGMDEWTAGMAEMDRAVALAPDRVGTLIPRGAVLFGAAPFVPEPTRTSLLDKALADYEKVLRLQAATFDRLSRHARSQLLFGLADGWQRRGDPAKARGYYQRLATIARGTPYGDRAAAYLAGDTTPSPMACGGCHAL